MTYNLGHQPRPVGAHFMYPLLSQLTPLPQSAVIKAEVPLPQHQTGTGNSSHNSGNSSHSSGKSQCPICQGHFSRKTDLKRHIETIHEGKRTQCLQCTASFARKNDLKRHIEAVHEGKQAKCLVCSASFSRKTDLKRHVETVHEGKRAHCPQCSASFARKTDLKRHIETVHEGKKAQCTICSASFSRQTDLRRHVESVHEGKPRQKSGYRQPHQQQVQNNINNFTNQKNIFKSTTITYSSSSPAFLYLLRLPFFFSFLPLFVFFFITFFAFIALVTLAVSEGFLSSGGFSRISSSSDSDDASIILEHEKGLI